MGKIKKPLPVKLIVGFIFKDECLINKAISILKKRFGKTDVESEILAFNHTDYYEKEMGKGLKRKFIAFKKLIPADKLSQIKLITNAIEKKLSEDNRRLINIDPGYVDLPKLVLASTKDFRHRIYIGNNIYAETTLFYQNEGFRPWEWTYPDYKSEEYIALFNRIRENYAQQIKNK